VRLDRVQLVNFRQHADTVIEFGPGVTAIIGPNGAGKTTLLEAIAWAFYGTPAVRGSRDSIRWNRAPARSPVRVDVEFGLGSHDYRVARTLYGAELFQDRADAPIANSPQEVTARVRRVLGMSREEFFNTYFTGQKELAVMASMGPTDRGRFLSRILGYERLRLAQDELRTTRSALRGELVGLERALGDPAELARERTEAERRCAEVRKAVAGGEKTMAAAVARRDHVGPAWTEMGRVRESVLALESDRRVADKDVLEARREFERLDREMAEALAAQSKLKELEPHLAAIAPLREELDRLEREGRAAGQRRLLTGQLAEVRSQAGRTAKRRLAIGDPLPPVREAQEELDAARARLKVCEEDEERVHTEWVRDKQDAETKRLTLRDQYRDLQRHREHVVEAGPDGACPTCARTLGPEYESVLVALAEQLEAIELNGRFFKQRVEQLAKEPDELVERRRATAEARAALEHAGERHAAARTREDEARGFDEELSRHSTRATDLEAAIAALPESYDAERHDAVRDRLRELEPTANQATAYRVQAQRAELLVQEAEVADRLASACEARVAELVQSIAALGYSDERYQAARAEYDAAEAAVREAELSLSAHQGDVKAAEAALASVTRRVEERAARAARSVEIRTDVAVHDELDEAFGDLRTSLNASLRPELSDIASGFLGDLTEGRYHELELDEQYRMTVLEDGDPKPVISGGEEDIGNLVLRLAISQMVAARAGQPFSLLVLDEIFGSLDDHRRQHVVQLLRRLGDRFPQVILITHIESVRDAVDRVLRVTLDSAVGAAIVREDAGGSDEDVAA